VQSKLARFIGHIVSLGTKPSSETRNPRYIVVTAATPIGSPSRFTVSKPISIFRTGGC